MSIALLQSQYNAASSSYAGALSVCNAVKSSLDASNASLAIKQANQAALTARLASALPKHRALIQAQVNAARIAVTLAQNATQRAQAQFAAAKANLDVKKAAMDALKARLSVAAAPLAPPPSPDLLPVLAPGIFKRALLVGINYTSSQYELGGCINDVLNVKTQFAQFFPSLADVNLITDQTDIKPSKANVIAAIRNLVNGLKQGENVYFHYSGHGGRVVDKNGDEAGGLDSCIYPFSNGALEPISDDELRAEIAVKIPLGCKCLVVLDSCHSGTAVDLRYLWETNSTGGLSYKEDTHYEKTTGDVLFLSAAMDSQYAMDTFDVTDRPCGALTWALLDTWRTYGPAIKTKYLLWDVRKFLKERGYDQVPQLSTGKYMDLQAVFDLSK